MFTQPELTRIMDESNGLCVKLRYIRQQARELLAAYDAVNGTDDGLQAQYELYVSLTSFFEDVDELTEELEPTSPKWVCPHCHGDCEGWCDEALADDACEPQRSASSRSPGRTVIVYSDAKDFNDMLERLGNLWIRGR